MSKSAKGATAYREILTTVHGDWLLAMLKSLGLSYPSTQYPTIGQHKTRASQTLIYPKDLGKQEKYLIVYKKE